MGYLSNFIVYTLAMVGVIALTLFVFKTSTSVGSKASSKFLKVQDTLSIGPRKTLFVVSAGEERFLIAGDVDKTTLISKLEVKSERDNFDMTSIEKNKISNESFERYAKITKQKNYMDSMNLEISSNRGKTHDSVIKNIAEILRS